MWVVDMRINNKQLVKELRSKNPYAKEMSSDPYTMNMLKHCELAYNKAVNELERLLKEKEFITRHAKNLAKEIDKKVIDELLKVK